GWGEGRSHALRTSKPGLRGGSRLPQGHAVVQRRRSRSVVPVQRLGQGDRHAGECDGVGVGCHSRPRWVDTYLRHLRGHRRAGGPGHRRRSGRVYAVSCPPAGERARGVQQRSPRTELLVSLGFVTSAAVILVGLTTVLLNGGDVRVTLWPLISLWVGSTAVFVLFGAYLVHRSVVRPLGVLAAEADRLAVGALPS